MINSALRWLLPIVALLIIGPLAGWLTAGLRAPDGGHAATLLASTSALAGLLAGVGVIALATVMGGATSRVLGAHFGLFCAGVVMAWGAWGTGTIDQLVRARPDQLVSNSGSLFTTLALESAVLLPLACASAWLIIRLARPPRPETGHHAEPTALRDPATAIGVLGALVAGGVVAYLIAQDTTKGQAFAAATVAGVAAAGAGRVLAVRTNAAAFIGAMAILAIVSPVSALAMHGGGAKSMLAAQAGTLFNLARPLPLDWIAGAFVGIPMGLAWAGSALEQHKK